MSYRLILTPEAQQDIESILLYTLRQWGEQQIGAYSALLNNALLVLQDNPDMGRNRAELYTGCRSYRVAQHIIYYVVHDNDIHVARVLHIRMDPQRHI